MENVYAFKKYGLTATEPGWNFKNVSKLTYSTTCVCVCVFIVKYARNPTIPA